jgi:hypothetical protein
MELVDILTEQEFLKHQSLSYAVSPTSLASQQGALHFGDALEGRGIPNRIAPHH